MIFLLSFNLQLIVLNYLESISSTFYAVFFCTKGLFSSYVLVKKATSYKKNACKMLVKLTPDIRRTTKLRIANPWITEVYYSIEETSSQKVCATSVSTGNLGGEPTLGHWPQCYRVWYEVEIFQINFKNLYYALMNRCNRL